MGCQDAAKTTEIAARGDGEMWEMCAHWMMDAHRRERLLFIWSVHPFSISPIKITAFTNTVSLQRDSMCSDDIISLIKDIIYRVQSLYIILL